MAIDRFKIITTENPIDFSAGACQLSDPDKEKYTMVQYRKKRVNGTEVDEPDDDYNKPQLLLAHQTGRNIVKSLPDPALLGILVLILSELLKRETKMNFIRLPPPLRAIVNETADELDQKLEFLSSMQWNVEPFIRSELENLQTQPLELIDKYIVTDILPRVDKEISPILNSLLGDPKAVSSITANIKEVIQIASVVLVQGGKDWSWEEMTGMKGLREKKVVKEESYFESTTAALLDGVDTLGDLAERAVEDWNNILIDLKSASKAKTVLDLRQQQQDDSLWARLTRGYTSRQVKQSLGKGQIDAEIELSGQKWNKVGTSEGIMMNKSSHKMINNIQAPTTIDVTGNNSTNPVTQLSQEGQVQPTGPENGKDEALFGGTSYRLWYPKGKSKKKLK